MACDVPCIATDIGDSAEIIGNSGLIVPLRNPRAVVQAWRALFENPSRLALARARSRIAAHYSLQRMCALYESLYRSIAGNNSEFARP
jgi:glycosyltransferase involved in cell wall biosynthesis